MTHGRIVAGMLFVAGLSSGCTQPQASSLCAAIADGDVASAERVLAGGPVDMLRQQGRCHPAFDVLMSNDGRAEVRHQILRAMLKSGLDPNATLSRSGGGRPGGQSARSTTTALGLVEWAASDLGAVEVLIAAGLDVKAPAAGRALALAAGDGSLDVVRRLVEAGTSVNEPLLASDNRPTAKTALGLAIAERHHAVTAYLEAKGALAALGTPSPIFAAATKGDLAVVDQAIAAGIDVNAEDDHGQSALFRAAAYGQTAVVLALVKAKANPNAVWFGVSVLEVAASEGRADAIRALAQAGAQLNGPADRSTTPLLRAVEGRHLDAVTALIDVGADANLVDAVGTTPLAAAVRVRDLRLVKTLIRGKADVNGSDALAGEPLLHVAVTGCETTDFDVPLLRAMVAAGANVKATNAEGKTALQKAETALQGETRPFYKACYEARVAALRALGGRPTVRSSTRPMG